MTFYEQELRKIVGERYPDATYVGRACYVRLSDMNRAKIQFVTGIVANQYHALQLTILNRNEGQVDVLRLQLTDLLGRKMTSNPISAMASCRIFGMTAARWTGMYITPPGRTMRSCPMRYQTIWRYFRI